MDDVKTNWENLSIYYANLSPIYFCTSLFTILALFFTWWFSQNVCNESESDVMNTKGGAKRKASRKFNKNNLSTAEGDTVGHTASQIGDEAGSSEKFSGEESMMRHIKTARQLAIEKQLTAGLSEEQLVTERETQASQLAAIYNLLRDKEDQFQIRSMDELQEQLKLYKS